MATLRAQGVAGRGARASVSLLYVMIWWVVTTACGALMSCSEAGAGKGGQEERREMWGWQCRDGLGSSQASKFQSKQKKLPERPEPLPERASGPRPRHMEWHTTQKTHNSNTRELEESVKRRVICKCVRVRVRYLIWAKQKVQTVLPPI